MYLVGLECVCALTEFGSNVFYRLLLSLAEDEFHSLFHSVDKMLSVGVFNLVKLEERLKIS